MAGYIFSTNQSSMNLLFKTEYMLRGVVQLVNIVTRVTVLHTIGWPKRNERLPDMTPNRILLDVNVSPKEKNVKKRYNKHLSLILDCIECSMT
jgi:hypothetical protein